MEPTTAPVAEAAQAAAAPMTVREALKACSEDRTALNELVAELLKDQFTDDLRIVEEICDHIEKTVPASNKHQMELLRQAYRSRILNTANRLLRRLPKITGDFIVDQVYVLTKQEVAVPAEEQIGNMIPIAAPPLGKLLRMHTRYKQDCTVIGKDGVKSVQSVTFVRGVHGGGRSIPQ